MIKLKDILFESEVPDIFIPRKLQDRAEYLIKDYVRNGNKGSLSLKNLNLTELPEILKNVSVSGYFNCSDNELINLKNSPKSVDGFFACYYNNLTSLEGCPKFVGGDFYCFKNRVQFTEADVRAVCNVKGKIIV